MKRKSIANHYKYLVILSMLFLASLTACALLEYKLLNVKGFELAAGSIAFPFAYLFSDMVAELYGYDVARYLFWGLIPANLFIIILVGVALLLPSAPTWHLQHEFMGLMKPLILTLAAGTPAIIVSIYVNVRILSKWKVLLRGKYFWLRCIGAGAIGEAVELVLIALIMAPFVFGLRKAIPLMIDAYLFRLVFITVMSVPTNLALALIKRSFQSSPPGIEFNPFSEKAESS